MKPMMATAAAIGECMPRIMPMARRDDPKAREGSRREVPLIFEVSLARPARRRSACRASRRASAASEILGADLCRDDLPGFPELSEPQVLRHFLRLSHLNFAQALQFYPLGSCTMKYNPVLNDEMASLPGFAALHPRTPGASRAGRARADGTAGSGARGNHRHGCGHARIRRPARRAS